MLDSEFKNVPYIGYYKLLVPAVVLRDAELIKNVLIRDIQYFAENDFQILEKHDPIFHHNPFLLKAENWKRARNVMVPSMTAGKVSAHIYFDKTIENKKKILCNYRFR